MMFHVTMFSLSAFRLMNGYGGGKEMGKVVVLHSAFKNGALL